MICVYLKENFGVYDHFMGGSDPVKNAYRVRGRQMAWRGTFPEEMIFELLRSKGCRAVTQTERQEERGLARSVVLRSHSSEPPCASPKELCVLLELHSQHSKFHYTESHLSMIHSCHGSNHIPPEDIPLSWSFTVGSLGFLFTLKGVHITESVVSRVVGFFLP